MVSAPTTAIGRRSNNTTSTARAAYENGNNNRTIVLLSPHLLPFLQMHVIDITFRSASDTPLSSIMTTLGVIVFWSPTSKANPTCIERGYILRHLAAHSNQLDRGTDVVIGMVNPSENGGKELDVELAETILIEVGKAINCEAKDTDDHSLELLQRSVEKNNGVRLRVWGRHPLRRPNASTSRLDGPVDVTVTMDQEGYLLFKAPWRKRP